MSKPPLTLTIHTLPFDKLGASTFERLCLWLVKAKGYKRAEHYGLSGTEQGRDIVAYLQNKQGEELWYFQCKRHREINISTLKKDVEKIRNLSLGKPSLKPSGVIFLITCSVSANIRDTIKQYGLSNGVQCEFWAHTELDMYVKEHSHIVREFFGVHDCEIPFISNPKQVRVIDTNTLERAEKLISSVSSTIIPNLSPLPIGSRMIYSHNPLFVGRRDDLKAISDSLIEGSVAQIAAITGLGGVGKTQLACEFVHRYGQYFAGGVFWLNFEDPESVPAEIAVCGGNRHMGLAPNFDRLPLETQVDLVLAEWDSPLPRLLIFDNVESESLLVKWKRVTGGARTIITSRRTDWSVTLGLEPCQLDRLPRKNSIELLEGYSALPFSEKSVLNDIAEELGDLPLALHLAGSFLARYSNSISPSTYLSQLSRPDLLNHPSLQGRGQKRETSPTLHEQHVARTFALSYERLDSNNSIDALAIKMLSRVAYLAPDTPIHKDLLFGIIDLDEENKESLLQAEDATHRLLELGLLEKETGDTFRLHRLLALFARETIAGDDARQDVEFAMITNARYWNSCGYSTPLVMIQSHLKAVTDESIPRKDENAATLCHHLGFHLYLAGDYRTSRKYFERALELYKDLQGETGKDYSLTLNNLGMVSRAAGDIEGARNYYELSLKIMERTDERDGYAMTALLNNLGLISQVEGKYKESLDYYKSALTYAEDHTQRDEILIAGILNNTGLLLHEQGSLDEAKPYYERALEIRQRLLGEYHQRTAEVINNIGGLYSVQGNKGEAKRYYSKALHLYESVLGEAHPDVARTLINLAGIHESENDPHTTRQYYERALKIYTTMLGDDHPDTLMTTLHLTQLLLRQGEYEAAHQLFTKLLSADKRIYGRHAESFANELTVLGDFLNEQGDDIEAQDFFAKAIEINDTLDDKDPFEKALPIKMLASIYQNSGNQVEATSLFIRALNLVEQKFGTRSDFTAMHLCFVADSLMQQGQLSECYPYYERAIEIYESIDPLHPNYAGALNNLATVLRLRGSYLLATEVYERALKVLENNSRTKSPEFIQGLNNLAVAHRKQCNYGTARSLLNRAISIAREIENPEGELVALCINNLATLSYYEGDHQAAERLIRQAISINEKSLGLEHPSTQSAIFNYSRFIMEQLGISKPEQDILIDGQSGLSVNITQGSRSKSQSRKKSLGRNSTCPCGSGKKFKKCCG